MPGAHKPLSPGIPGGQGTFGVSTTCGNERAQGALRAQELLEPMNPEGLCAERISPRLELHFDAYPYLEAVPVSK
jgi:hypothetical protein